MKFVNKTILSLLLAFMLTATALALTVDVNGPTDGNSTTVPFVLNNGPLRYSHSALLYPATKFTGVYFPIGITQIDITVTGGAAYTVGGTMNVYLKEVSLTNLSAASNWNGYLTGATLMYSSTTQNVPASGFFSIPFNQGGGTFTYNGTNNLLVIVTWARPSSPHPSGQQSWARRSTGNTNLVRVQNKSSTIGGTETGTLSAELPVIRFTYGSLVNWSNNQTSTGGPGTTAAWDPTFPNDASTGGGTRPAGDVFFPVLGAGSNPTIVSIRRDIRTNSIGIWGLNQTEMDYYIPAASTLNRFWQVTQTGGSNFNATLELNFTSTDYSGTTIIDPVTDIVLAAVKHGALPWAPYPVTVTGPDGNGVYTATLTGINQFSEFTLVGPYTPLPVQMSSFSANATNEGIQIMWRVESEINNLRFNLYRSTEKDVVGTVVASIEGRGTTAEPMTYRFMDRSVEDGVTYFYSISDVDIDGSEHFYHRVATAVAGFNPSSAVIEKYALHQNYPNPFNPTTEISFTIRENGFVTMTVYDLQGREVSKLVNGKYIAGTHRVSFDGSNLPTGVYVYKLQTNQFTTLKKMLLVK